MFVYQGKFSHSFGFKYYVKIIHLGRGAAGAPSVLCLTPLSRGPALTPGALGSLLLLELGCAFSCAKQDASESRAATSLFSLGFLPPRPLPPLTSTSSLATRVHLCCFGPSSPPRRPPCPRQHQAPGGETRGRPFPQRPFAHTGFQLHMGSNTISKGPFLWRDVFLRPVSKTGSALWETTASLVLRNFMAAGEYARKSSSEVMLTVLTVAALEILNTVKG